MLNGVRGERPMITLSATITKDDGTTIELTQRNLISIEQSILERPDATMPYWGIISNSGKIKFIDVDGSIKVLAQEKLLKSGMRVSIKLTNTISSAFISVGEFFTEKWDYDNDTKNVTVSIKDELKKWQEILLTPIKYNPYSPKNLSARQIYEQLYTLTPTEFDMPTFDNLDDNTKNHLETCIVQFFILDFSNLWSAWNAFCEAFFVKIYKINNGNTICVFREGD